MRNPSAAPLSSLQCACRKDLSAPLTLAAARGAAVRRPASAYLRLVRALCVELACAAKARVLLFKETSEVISCPQLATVQLPGSSTMCTASVAYPLRVRVCQIARCKATDARISHSVLPRSGLPVAL